MTYADCFLLVVPKKNLKSYLAIAKKAGDVWREHGALEYRECVGEDLKLKPGCGLPFPKRVQAKPSDVVVFSWIVYKSRAHRDKVNAKVMADPRLAGMMNPKDNPFDESRMFWGGFEVIVDV